MLSLILVVLFVPIVRPGAIPDHIWKSSDLSSYDRCKNKFKMLVSDWDPKAEMGDIPDHNIQGLVVNAWGLTTWPSGRVPYTLSNRIGDYDQKKIACGMLFFHTKTCLRFVPYKRGDRNYITINNVGSEGCFSSRIGMGNGPQTVNLGDGCWHHGTVVHELMHAIGFFHEQSRDDRDQHIRVNWGNIYSSWKSQFKTSSQQGYSVKLLGNYDYGSVMHYGRYGVSNGPSMDALRAPKDQNNRKMGNRGEATTQDVWKINKLYSCPAGGGGGGGSTDGTDAPPQPTTQSPPSDCRDISSRCSQNKWQCNRNSYVDKKCQKTCGHCSSGGGGGNCSDTSSRCAANKWQCNSNSYVAKKCQRTCGKC